MKEGGCGKIQGELELHGKKKVGLDIIRIENFIPTEKERKRTNKCLSYSRGQATYSARVLKIHSVKTDDLLFQSKN